MTVRVFYIGMDRFFVEFDENGKGMGFHIKDNHTKIGKLMTKRLYKWVKDNNGSITYHTFDYSRYFEKATPQQIIEI